MKKLILSFCLFLSIQSHSFEYNAIQQAIVANDPDKLEQLLKNVHLRPSEKEKYIDLAEKIILDYCLPYGGRLSRPEILSARECSLINYSLGILLVSSFVLPFGMGMYDDIPEKYKQGMLCVLAGILTTLVVSGITFGIQVEKWNLRAQELPLRAVKVKQILFDA